MQLLLSAAVLSGMLGLAAGYQLFGESRDYQNYLGFFSWLQTSDGLTIFQHRFEPGFVLLSYVLVTAKLSGPALFGAIAAACLFIKYAALPPSRNLWALFVVFTTFYLSRYYVLFETTVLRATVAFSLAFLAFCRIPKHGRNCSGVLLLLVAVSMHYSAIVLLPVYLLRLNSRMAVVIAAVAAYMIVVAVAAAALELLPVYLATFAAYEGFYQATFLPIPMALDLAFLGFALMNWRTSDDLMRTCLLGMAMAGAIHFGLLEYSLLAGRFRELLSVFVLLYVVRAISEGQLIVRTGVVAYVVLSSAMHLYINLVRDPLLT